MTLSDLEELQARRIKLAEETRSLERKQKKLEDNVLILEEKISIEQLEKQQRELMKKVSNLESQKNGLESKLTKDPADEKSAKKKSSKKKVTSKPKKKKAVPKEEGVTITTVVNQPIPKQKFVQTSRNKPEKKKRFFF